jgi:hypothetical protein
MCRHCGERPGRWRGTRAHGYCIRCFKRWMDHGYPASGPPPLRRGAGPKQGRGARIEDYIELRSWGLSQAEAARRLGVVRRTVVRYERAARAGSGLGLAA